MDNFWNILKREDIRNEAQYERASPDERKKWHEQQKGAYDRRLKNLQTTATVTNEDSPMYKEMVELQELYRFHSRQENRLIRLIRTGKSKQDYYSKELETNRKKHKGQQTPQGSPMPYKELSQEIYETLTDNKKRKYHIGMSQMVSIPEDERKFHVRMSFRIKNGYKYPTFATSKYGGESEFGKITTKEEYENMSRDEKRKFHVRMVNRFNKKGNIEMRKFHQRMQDRLRRNTKLPVYFSPEEEQ